MVARRRSERGGKVGHAGTLDPFATGLLIVLLGRATRLQRYLLELPKTYLADRPPRLALLDRRPGRRADRDGRGPRRASSCPPGEIEQRVPMTSAVKVGGERLYKKAHSGEEVETPTRTVTVHRAELLESDEERASFEIECSSGTYVRTLIETLDDAYCESLRRTAIGPFAVPDDASVSSRVEELMSFLPERALSSEEAERGESRTCC